MGDRGKRKQSCKKTWIDHRDGLNVIIPQSHNCLDNSHQYDLSNKFGPETEKVFAQLRRAEIRLRYMGELVNGNHTIIDRRAQGLKKSNLNDLFQEMIVWKTLEIARSRWDINEDGKAVCSDNYIIMTEPK
jgi:hypothetical protein